MSGYPGPHDYIAAVQHPETSFSDADLKQARFHVSPTLGIPLVASGNSAVVFRAEVRGEDQALRFFTRDDVSDSGRYTRLAGYLRQHELDRHVAQPEWADRAIRIGENWYPMVRMQWVEGRTLDRYVDHLVQNGDVRSLTTLAETWRGLVRHMQDGSFAHGDLQHGNVLVDQRGALRLVDLDCAWIMPFEGGSPPPEAGHRNYQPAPGRTWGRWMDTFPALVIYLSLLTLSRNPRPWSVLNDDDNLLFTANDFRSFETPAWQHIRAVSDPAVDRVARTLRECCSPRWTADRGLEGLLTVSRHQWVVEVMGPEATVAAAGATESLPTPPPKEVPRQPWPYPTGPEPRFEAPRPGTTGVRPTDPEWWKRTAPPVPAPGPEPVRRGALLAGSIGIAVAFALLVGMIAAAVASGNRADGGPAFLVTFLVVLVLAAPFVYAFRRPPPGP